MNTLTLARVIKKSTRKAYAHTLLNAVIRDYATLRAVGQYQCKNRLTLRNKVNDLRIRLMSIQYTYVDLQINRWS